MGGNQRVRSTPERWVPEPTVPLVLNKRVVRLAVRLLPAVRPEGAKSVASGALPSMYAIALLSSSGIFLGALPGGPIQQNSGGGNTAKTPTLDISNRREAFLKFVRLFLLVKQVF
jgi:hypothetical protein